jgi:ATP-dependent DNA helicase RecQ
VLRGSKKERVLKLKHDLLSTYAIGEDHDQHYWGSVIRHLVHCGYLEQDVGNYAVLRLQDSAWPLLRGEEGLEMARPRLRQTTGSARKKRQVQLDMHYDQELFERLRQVRSRCAEQAGVPPFVIFHDKTLVDMAVKRPATLEEMQGVHGVGLSKCERYGEVFLEEIQKAGGN